MGTIGAVLTPEMKEQTIYVSWDGLRFDSAEECLLWEELRDKYQKIFDTDLGAEDEENLEAMQLFKYDAPQFRNKGEEFVRWAKAIKALNDWLWSKGSL